MRVFLWKILWTLAPLFLLSGCAETGGQLMTTYRADSPEALTEEAAPLLAAEQEERKEDLCVYVCGAVEAPGVYTLPSGARVADAIAAAGGLLPEADETAVNQARRLTDGEQLTIPLFGESAFSAPQPGAVSGDGRININTADLLTLQQLRGIGEKKAEAIIAYREEHGSFASIEELKQVEGIGDALLQKLKEEITVG